jgi:hypothetical protein
MFELLNSNYQPVSTQCRSFEIVFYSLLREATKIKIATGYVSEESVAALLGKV